VPAGTDRPRETYVLVLVLLSASRESQECSGAAPWRKRFYMRPPDESAKMQRVRAARKFSCRSVSVRVFLFEMRVREKTGRVFRRRRWCAGSAWHVQQWQVWGQGAWLCPRRCVLHCRQGQGRWKAVGVAGGGKRK